MHMNLPESAAHKASALLLALKIRASLEAAEDYSGAAADRRTLDQSATLTLVATDILQTLLAQAPALDQAKAILAIAEAAAAAQQDASSMQDRLRAQALLGVGTRLAGELVEQLDTATEAQ
jgi:hypothetical protein